MKIEKWKIDDKEVDIPVLDEDEIEDNMPISNTLDLTDVIKTIGEKDE